MLYFIPAWYQKNQWCENEQNWYVRRTHTEFDDTVKQIQLFHRNKAYPYRIMLLSFAPNFRHFIHRQSVYHAPYWSCFDSIQEIRRRKAAIFSFHDLKWPKGVEFVYTPFVIFAMYQGRQYARMEFGEDGNLIQIDMYENNMLCRRNIYDDRGFVSATIVYENERPIYQDYLMENGMRKLRCFYNDGHIEINHKFPEYLIQHDGKEYNKSFMQETYSSLDEVIAEVLKEYLTITGEEDIFCIAMHERHSQMLNKVLNNKKKILTFFENRYDIRGRKESLEMLKSADYIITDSQENTDIIKELTDRKIENITDITPYDSRVDFGISQQLNVQKIMVPVDGIDEYAMKQLIANLGEYLLTNDKAQIHLFTRSADYNIKEKLYEKTRMFLAESGFRPEWAIETKETVAENNLEEDELEEGDKVKTRFFIEQCVDELSVSKCMREQRIIVDMRNMTELYLRIAAISMGIPQIVHIETKFVNHKKNGYILKDVNKLPDVLKYYLDSLKNWNEAMVESYELGKEYTTAVLVKKWKEVIEFVR